MDSNEVVILDIRVPSLPAAKLKGHSQVPHRLAPVPPPPSPPASAAPRRPTVALVLSPLRPWLLRAPAHPTPLLSPRSA